MFRERLLWLMVCALLSFALLAYPLYVIRPFRYQGPSELAAALAVTRIGPFVEIVLFIAAFALLVWIWRTADSAVKKISAWLCFLLVAVCAVLSRVNVYEMLFHPLGRPAFVPAAAATTLQGGEEVIAVRINGAARAYPIRIISYHHIVNDAVGGLPIVATY